AGLLEGLAEAIQLELGGQLDRVAQRRRARDLALQHGARRFLDEVAVLAVHVAEDERGLRQPGDHSKRGHIRHHLHVAVAALPGGAPHVGATLSIIVPASAGSSRWSRTWRPRPRCRGPRRAVEAGPRAPGAWPSTLRADPSRAIE